MKPNRRPSPLFPRVALAALLLACGQATARQDARPAPRYAPDGRKIIDGEPQPLGFKQATVEQLVAFVVEASGKVVMPQQDILSRRITVLNERPIPRSEALDLVLLALQQNGIAVVETATTITLRDIAEITRQDVPVLGPDQSVLNRTDLGAIAEKVFRLKHSSAENYKDVLKDIIPDYAKLTVDEESNQVAVMGPIALLQRLERLIGSLDSPASGALVTETFRLRYADSEQIKENIEELFTEGTARTRAGQQRQQQGQQQRQPFFQAPGQQGAAQTASSEDLRVTANTQQNSVTVVAEPAIIEQIRRQIEDYWDKPLPDEAVVPKIYDLKNSDPIKVRDLLEGLFGQGSSSASTPAQPGQQGGGAARGPSEGQGVGRLAGQFSFEALPESGRLVVVAKSPDNLAVIDKIIEDLDQPQMVGLPAMVQLKHASAEDLAEQLNTLLAQDGTLAQIRRSESGLSEASSTVSPFAQEATTQDADGSTTTEETTSDVISFWWQRSRPPTDRANASNMVGQIRIVPVWRQNALMVLAPQEYKNSLVGLIEDLDKPGRQVLIAATVLDLTSDDATALGLRWSSSAITPLRNDNAINIGTNTTATANDFLGNLFDTSVLNLDVDLNVLLQALAQKTKINILSEPKVFTGDNQEAEFFSGQDIPFITESQTTDQGNLVQSFDYRAVGIALRVRPRITPKHEVDLRVNLELSSVVPGQTLFGGAIVDRRETTTQVIIKSGQTVVISGLVRTLDTKTVRKVPLLGSIPILGAIFRSVEKGKTNIEVVAFITPVVVDNSEDAADLTRPLLEQSKDRAKELNLDRSPELNAPLPAPPPPQTEERGS